MPRWRPSYKRKRGGDRAQTGTIPPSLPQTLDVPTEWYMSYYKYPKTYQPDYKRIRLIPPLTPYE